MKNIRKQTKTFRISLIIGGIIVLILFGIIFGGYYRQMYIHNRGSMVMPFSLSATMHVFHATSKGGIEQVIAREENDTTDIQMIRMHLNMISQEFSRGDFSAPTALHGQKMPGVDILETKYQELQINYTELNTGAQITFQSNDSEVVNALHLWFNAQLQDHGQDATDQLQS